MKNTNIWLITLGLIVMMGLNACENKKKMTENVHSEKNTEKVSHATIEITAKGKVYKFYEDPKHNCLVYNKKVMSRAIKNEQIQFAVEQRQEGVWLLDYREKAEGETGYTDYSGKKYKIDYDGKQIKGTAVMERDGEKDISLSFYVLCS